MSYPRLTKCMPDETRHNPFYQLHKALRFGHCRMLCELGAQDFGDGAVATHVLTQLVRQVDLYQAVAEARLRALRDALAGRGLELSPATVADHLSHMAALAELQSLVRAINVAAPQRRRLAGRNIYRCYALYTSADMQRMDEEETILLTTLHQGLGEDDMRAIAVRTFDGLSPDHVGQIMALLLQALFTAEREVLLGELRTHFSPDSFAAIVEPAIGRLRGEGDPLAA